jgi:hypothetical protein
MMKAQDVAETIYMRNICSQLIIGLAIAVTSALLDDLMTLIETNLSFESTSAEISTSFHTMEAIIRARCHMLSNVQAQVIDEQKAMMFAVQQGDVTSSPKVTPSPSIPQQSQSTPSTSQPPPM